MTGADSRRAVLEALLEAARPPTDAEVQALAAEPPDAVDDALRAFARAHGAAAVPVLHALAGEGRPRAVRRAARRALYRLGPVAAPAPAPRPVVTRSPERAVRAWLSGIDATGARAVWILFGGAWGALRLASLILSDTEGVVDAAGGEITKKRLDRELAELRASQKLPWVETDPARAVGLVAEALALHAARGTAPVPAFARWRPLFEGTPAAGWPPLPAEADAALVERSAELLELPELAGWFLAPHAVQADAVELLQTRESRLVVSDQIRAEREEAIVGAVVEREFGVDGRHRWARRLAEMAPLFDATGRPEPAALARAAAAALLDAGRDVRRHPLAVNLARRGLEIASEIALGRLSASDFSRLPAPGGEAGGEEPGGARRPESLTSPPLIVSPYTRPR